MKTPQYHLHKPGMQAPYVNVNNQREEDDDVVMEWYLHGACGNQWAAQNTSDHIPLRAAERDAEPAARLALALFLL